MLFGQTNAEYRRGVDKPADSKLYTHSCEMSVLRHNHRQVEEEMGTERYRKEHVCDMTDDINLIKDYLTEKLGGSVADVQRRTSYSKMAEMELEKEKVGWYLMATAGEEKLRKWLDTIIEKGELGAVGGSPPDLLEELGLQPEDMDIHCEDPEDEGSSMGQMEQVCAVDNRFECLQALS